MKRTRTTGHRWLRVAAVATLVVATLLPAAGPVLAAPSLVVNPSSGVVGATLDAAAAGFPSLGVITFWWDNAVMLGTKTATQAGAASLSFKIPLGASLGTHTVRACGGSFCPNGAPQPHADDTVSVIPNPTPRPTRTPTPTRAPTPRPTTTPAPSAGATVGPSVAPSASPGPSPTGVGIPVPSFPLAGATPIPTPLPLVAITPAPHPPDGLTVPDVVFPNLFVAGLEVTQGIQNLANDMPLVAGRRTYSRVYIGVTGEASWPHTWGALEARRAGQHIGWIWPENGPIVAKAGNGDRTNLDDSLYFRLPASWLSGGVQLTTFIFSYGIDTPFTKEPTAADNTWQESVYFNEALPLTLHLAPLHMHRSWHPSDVERTFLVPGLDGLLAPGADLSALGVTNRVVAGAYRYLPIAQLNLDPLYAPVYPLNHFDGHEFDLGGPCRSTLVEIMNFARFVIADWTILMKDPASVTPDADDFIQADREELRILDRTYTVISFAARPDGTGEVYAGHDNNGPALVLGAPVYAYGCAKIVDADAEPNHAMGLYRVFYDWQEEREMFVGMVHPSLRAQWGGFSTGSADSVWVRWLDEYGEDDPWRHGGAAILGHETAHSSGLNHVPCKDSNADGVPDELVGGALDLTHPSTLTFPDCWLSEVDPDGFYGFDTAWDRYDLNGPTVLSNDPAQAFPNRAFPFLSYASPGWSDPYHYCRLLAYYGVPCSATELGLPWNRPPPEPDGSDPFAAVTPPPAPLEHGVDSMVVTYTGLEDGTWTLDIVARNPDPTANDAERIAAEHRATSSEVRHSIVVLDAAGTVKWRAILPLVAVPHEAEGGAAMGDAVVPVWPDTSAIEIHTEDGRVLARAVSKGGRPDIAGLFKDTADGETLKRDAKIVVSFSASDPDGDRLRFFVLYAPDRKHWQLVGVTDTGSFATPVADLPSGSDPAFRLVAFDGWSVDEADLPVPELAGPRNPPTVMILASNPRSYPLRSLVRLDASAFDLEDRALPGESIRWSSSLDGDLGPGSELATQALRAGRHVITATAIDSDGLEGSASYELEVDGSVVQVLPAADVIAGIDGIFDRLGRGLDAAPGSVDKNPDFAWLPLAALALLSAIGLVLGLRVWTVRRAGSDRSRNGAP